MAAVDEQLWVFLSSGFWYEAVQSASPAAQVRAAQLSSSAVAENPPLTNAESLSRSMEDGSQYSSSPELVYSNCSTLLWSWVVDILIEKPPSEVVCQVSVELPPPAVRDFMSLDPEVEDVDQRWTVVLRLLTMVMPPPPPEGVGVLLLLGVAELVVVDWEPCGRADAPKARAAAKESLAKIILKEWVDLVVKMTYQSLGAGTK
jgi:hypothetical protein